MFAHLVSMLRHKKAQKAQMISCAFCAFLWLKRRVWLGPSWSP
jgi:hypothetical protein